MSHKHVICDQGYDIERCRCPGPITQVKPCFEGHKHGILRWEPKTGPAVQIKEEVVPANVNNTESVVEALSTANAKVQYLIDWADKMGYLADGCFTFPDGDTDWATGKEPT
jgi:hypothetical protein